MPLVDRPIPVGQGGIADGHYFRETFSGQELTVAQDVLLLPTHPQRATLWIVQDPAKN